MQGEQNAIDFLKVNLQAQNKRRYFQTVKQTITTQKPKQSIEQSKVPSEQQLQAVMQQYEEDYLKFMYKDTLMTNSKSNGLIDDCLNNVHQGLKSKKDCKFILSIMSKIFVQELIEESLQIVEEYKEANLSDKMNKQGRSSIKRPEQIDIEVIEQAYRRRLLKKEKI